MAVIGRWIRQKSVRNQETDIECWCTLQYIISRQTVTPPTRINLTRLILSDAYQLVFLSTFVQPTSNPKTARQQIPPTSRTVVSLLSFFCNLNTSLFLNHHFHFPALWTSSGPTCIPLFPWYLNSFLSSRGFSTPTARRLYFANSRSRAFRD